MTDREKYESFLRSKNIEPLQGESLTWDLWQASAKLKDKEIEQLKARLHEVSTDWQVNQAKLAMCVEALNAPIKVNALYHNTYCNPEGFRNAVEHASDEAKKALSATEQDVAKWKREIEAKAIEECAEELDYMAGVELALKDIAQQKRSDR